MLLLNPWSGMDFSRFCQQVDYLLVAYYYHWCKERTDTRRSQSCNCSQCNQVDTSSCNYLPHQCKYLQKINEKSTTIWEAFNKWSLKYSQIICNRISVSYSNFNWTIKAIIGAKFNIKHVNCFFSVYKPDSCWIWQFFGRLYVEKPNLKWIGNFFLKHSSASWIQAQKLQMKRVRLLRCTKKVIYCLFVYGETYIKGTLSIKQAVANVLNCISLIYFKWNLY